MHVHRIIVPLLLALTVHSANADSISYSFDSAMDSKDVRKILDPSIHLYFGTQPTPPLAEKSLPNPHSRSGLSVMMFGRDPDVLCREGFADNIEELIVEAKKMGFDTVFNIRGQASANGPVNNTGFDCGAGRRTSEVRLIAEYGLTMEGAKRAEQMAQQAVVKPRKAPSKNAIFLPLAEVIASPEAMAVLGPIKAYAGLSNAPAYSERFGPVEYDGEGDVRQLGREGACRKAVVEALSSMKDDVLEQGYNSVIRIRSYLDEQFAPDDAQFECEAGSKTASVNFLVTLANVK